MKVIDLGAIEDFCCICNTWIKGSKYGIAMYEANQCLIADKVIGLDILLANNITRLIEW